MTVTPCELPPAALLRRYREAGAYTDCFRTEVGQPVPLARFVEAFYTTSVFKLERLVLRIALSRPSTDQQARELGSAMRHDFAAWTVEDRNAEQLLLGDIGGRTKSWLMVEGVGAGSRLYFGSAVIPVLDRRTGKREMGLSFRSLLGFHQVYSRVLLQAARVRLLAPSKA